MNDRHSDTRYNSFSLSHVPASRASVRHTREPNPNPLRPRTFIPANSRNPIEFIHTTEIGRLGWYLPPPFYPYHYSSREKYGPSFYFEPLTASRDQQNSFFDMQGNDDNTTPVSRHPIFTLPEVCVQNILYFLGHGDLAALALVDRDCLQLARACLFRSVWINYSSASMALLETLVDEGCSRVTHPSSHQQPKWTLGACIRRISVAFESEKQETKYQPTCWIDDRRRSYDAVSYHQRHMNLLELALRTALPNLEFLDWWDRIPISRIMANSIIHSRITRLELHGVLLSQDFDVSGSTDAERRMLSDHDWQLRRLVLDVGVLGRGSSCAPIFTASLLKLAARNLEELVWEATLFTNDSTQDSHSFGTDSVCFKRLKKLHMTRVPLADDTVMNALVPPTGKPSLEELFVVSPEPKLGPFFASQGHISSLKLVNWAEITPYNDIDHFVSFVAANPQLDTFRTEDTTLKLLDERLVPLFAGSFRSLTSLALVFDTAVIAPASLALIGTIAPLKQLWLSAGDQWSVSSDWFVDHDSLRENLAPLAQLELFALTLDLYPNGNKHSLYQRPPKPQSWENGHSRLMSRHAMEFAKSHPKLAWVYLGEVPMRIERAGGAGEVVDAVPLTEKRKDCELLLKQIWGAECVDWVYQT